jgi:hypothetical protein
MTMDEKNWLFTDVYSNNNYPNKYNNIIAILEQHKFFESSSVNYTQALILIIPRTVNENWYSKITYLFNFNIDYRNPEVIKAALEKKNMDLVIELVNRGAPRDRVHEYLKSHFFDYETDWYTQLKNQFPDL